MTNKLTQNGHLSKLIELPKEWNQLCLSENYDKLDTLAKNALKPNGFLYNEMKSLCSNYFVKERTFEHILSLRIGPQDEEFDGIWHDDGTRYLAFSMSLNLNYQDIRGGELLMRPKHNKEEIKKIEARPFGTLTIFCTGKDDWEHKTSLVNHGKRLVLAGWLS